MMREKIISSFGALPRLCNHLYRRELCTSNIVSSGEVFRDGRVPRGTLQLKWKGHPTSDAVGLATFKLSNTDCEPEWIFSKVEEIK